jgi:ribosomal protein L11 methyltransferase
MADYIELSVPVCDGEQAEILMAELAEFPFESFQQEETQLRAYIREDELEKCRGEVTGFLTGRLIRGTYTRIETVNWNERWESGFEPVDVDGRCLIRAPFHGAPAAETLDVVIMPKMSFGTGHHATTWLMVSAVLDNEFAGLRGLDMGSGTGVLAIVAAMRGASQVDAVDIDEWSYENCAENITVNGVADKVTPILGDVSAIAGRRYDFILANINRNILLADMEAYRDALATGGLLVVSGVLEADIPAIEEKARSLGFAPVHSRVKDGWAALEFVASPTRN